MSSAPALELLSPELDRRYRQVPIGPGLVLAEQAGRVVCFPIQRLGFRARITGPTAAVEVFQTFVNSSSQPIEGTYLFPLGAGGSLVQLRISVGQRPLEGQVQAREVALERFAQREQPRFLGQLFEFEQAPILSIGLGRVAPNEVVDIQLAYAELLETADGGFRFHFPLLMHPCLASGTPVEQAGRVSEQLVLPPGLNQGAQVAMSLVLDGGELTPGQLACSQPVATQVSPRGDMAIEFSRQNPLNQRDFTLNYQLWTERAPKAWLRTGPKHFLLNLFPPASRVASFPRDLVILVEGSEAMKGENFDIVRQGIARLLGSLEPAERFALVCFNRELEGYRQGVFCPAEEVPQGLEWIGQYNARGIADLKVLLGRVLHLSREKNRTLGVVIMACGGVGNEPELFQMIQSGARGIRFFTVGVGQGVNRSFLRKVARSTQGTCYMAGPGESLLMAMQQLSEDTRQPILSDLQLLDRDLHFQGDSVTPEEPGVVCFNRPLTIMGLRAGEGGVEIQGRSPSGTVWAETAAPGPASNPALHMVWAHEKVRELQDELHLQVGPKTSLLSKMIQNLAVEYRLLSEFTSYVVMDGASRVATVQPGLIPSSWKTEDEFEGEGLSASELLQAAQEEEEKLEQSQKPRREGLRMKDTAITTGNKKFSSQSKLSGENRLHGGVKTGVVTKPMLDRSPRTNAGPAPAPTPTPTPTPPPGPTPPTGPTVPSPEPPPGASPEQVARELLRSDPRYRELLMGEMRTLYSSLGASAQGPPHPQLRDHLEKVLERVKQIAPRSPVLQEVYRVGHTYYQSLLKGEEEAVPRIQFWITRFATLF